MIKQFWCEQWKEIEFEEGALKKRYALSNYGRIISFTSKIEEGTLIKGSKLNGYATLPIRPFGKPKTIYIHKKVAEFFLTKQSEEQKYVIHKDYNKTNNYFENLVWANNKEMFAHQQNNPEVLKAREDKKERSTHQGNKLSSTDVIRIKKRIFDPNRKTRLKLIAKQFGISEMQLYRIKSGENWSHIKVNIEENER